jgi:hypothetical protein
MSDTEALMFLAGVWSVLAVRWAARKIANAWLDWRERRTRRQIEQNDGRLPG